MCQSHRGIIQQKNTGSKRGKGVNEVQPQVDQVMVASLHVMIHSDDLQTCNSLTDAFIEFDP